MTTLSRPHSVREDATTLARRWNRPYASLSIVAGFFATVAFAFSFVLLPEEGDGFFTAWRFFMATVAIVATYIGLAHAMNGTTATVTPETLVVTNGPVPFGERTRTHRRSPHARFVLVHEWHRGETLPRYRILVFDQNGIPWTVFGHGLNEQEARYLATRLGELWQVPVDLSAARAVS